VRELADHKTKIGAELRVHVYCLLGRGFFVAPLNGKSGLWVEMREVTILPDNVAPEILGRAVCDNLLWNVPDLPRSLREQRTKSDWPAYIASGLKTVRQFENEAIYIVVSTVNTAFRVEARPLNSFLGEGVFLGKSLPMGSHHDEIGLCLGKLLAGVALLQRAEFL
jgi:hypothetical protein